MLFSAYFESLQILSVPCFAENGVFRVKYYFILFFFHMISRNRSGKIISHGSMSILKVYTYFTDEESEAQRDYIISQGHIGQGHIGDK